MRDQPEAGRLLEQARQTLLQEVLDLLPAGQRYPALMVANAMAIAVREIEQGGQAAGEEGAALAALFDATETSDLAVLERRLAREIRAGRHDGAAPVHALLSESVTRRLRITNPKLLAEGPGD